MGNIPQIGVLSIALIFTTIYWLNDKKYHVGVIAFGAWFIMFATTMYYDPNAWGEAVFFAGLSMLHVFLLMLDYAGASKVDFWN